MTTTTPDHAQTQTTLSLGAQCRQARETLNLSLEDVAKQINLRPSVLQYIENDELFHKFIPATFMKGYIRNYAKFLRLPDSVWLGALQTIDETTHNDFSRTARVKKVTHRYSEHHRWLSCITAAIVVILITMTALWWWENYRQHTTERNVLVKNYLQENTVSTPNALVQESENGSSDNAQTENLFIAAESNAPEINAQSDNASASPSLDTTLESATENTRSDGHAQNAINAVNTVSDEMKKTAPPPILRPEAELYIEITESTCWISVKNGKGKILAEKEYKKGDVLTFNQNDHYSLIIGAPGNVSIYYKGNPYPLTVDGKVARFTLP